MILGWIPSFGLYVIGLLILGITFRNYLKKNKKSTQNNWISVLEQEHAAQFVRSKPLDEKLFINIDFTLFPHVEEISCQNQYLALMHYAKSPMINLKNESNLTLKSTYGPQIVEEVAAYEKNYLDCMNTAIQYAEQLLQQGYLKEAQTTLEICINYHCDISKCYLLLIDLYKQQSNLQGLTALKEIATIEMQNSPFLNKILHAFQ